MSVISSWRAALRIARREARRSKGRSALVAMMLAVPVLGLTFLAVTYSMFSLTGVELATQHMGAADALIMWDQREAIWQSPDAVRWATVDAGKSPQSTFGTPTQATAGKGGSSASEIRAELLAALPAGSAIVEQRKGSAQVRRQKRKEAVSAITLDASSPLATGLVTVLEGRVPQAATEIAVSPRALVSLDLTVGGTLTGVESGGVFHVVGVVEFPGALDTAILFDSAAGVPGVSDVPATWLVDSPAPMTWNDVTRLNALGMVVESRAVLIDPPPASQIAVEGRTDDPLGSGPDDATIAATVGAGLAFLEIVLIAGPAFAISARRRRRHLALAAANGATPAHLRRIVLADGVVLSMVGALAGMVLGGAAAVIARPWLEELLFLHRAGGYRVSPLAVVGIVCVAVVSGLTAAAVPAWTVARQDVVTSLAGRSGVTRTRRRWLVLGAVMVAAGVGLVAVGARAISLNVMLPGVIVGELGMVLCMPAVIGVIATAGRLLPVSLRIALRDASRNRAAAASAVAAVMAAVAGSVALAIFGTVGGQQEATSEVPLGYAIVQMTSSSELDLAAIEAAMRSSLPPITRTHRISRAECLTTDPTMSCTMTFRQPPDRVCPYLAELGDQPLTGEKARAARRDPRCRNGGQPQEQVVVADATAIATLTGATGDDLRRAERTLREGGIVVGGPDFVSGGVATVEVMTSSGDGVMPLSEPKVDYRDAREVAAHQLTTGIRNDRIIVSPALVDSLGLRMTPTEIVAATSRTPTQEEQDRFVDAMVLREANGRIEQPLQSRPDPVLWVLTAGAAVITLGATGVATALTGADSKETLVTLAAVGATPWLRRALSLSQAAVIAGLGSTIGVFVGLGAAAGVLAAYNARLASTWPSGPELSITVPWLNLAVTLLVVPTIAMAGAGLFTRSRLPSEHRR